MLPARWGVKYFIFLKFKMRDSSSEIMHVIGTCTHNFFLLLTREIILLNIHMHSAKNEFRPKRSLLCYKFILFYCTLHTVFPLRQKVLLWYIVSNICLIKWYFYHIQFRYIEIDELCRAKRYRKFLAIQPSFIFMRESSSSLYCSLSKDINFN